jgi:ketosteroid isomerase-like protein
MRLPTLLIVTLFSSTRKADAQHDLPVPPKSADAIAAIRLLNQEYIDAARTNDARWFSTHMADDVVVVLGSGRRLTKPEFLRMLAEEPKSYKSLTARSVTVRAFGATLQVDADAPWELSDGASGVSRYIDTYAWIDGRWQVISAQITWLPKPN